MSLAPPPAPGQDAIEPPGSAAAVAVRPGRARAFLDTYRYPLAIFGASRLLTFLAVGMVGWVSRPKGSTDLGRVFLTPLRQWDGVWYLQIAQYDYDPTLGHGNAAAFFPLYPWLIRGLRYVAPLSYALIGVAVSTLLFAAAMCLLYRLSYDRFGEQIARRTVLYLGLAPLTFVFSAVYTESLALTLVLWSFLLLERGRPGAASFVGALAVLTRPVGIVLAPAIAWRVFDDHGRRFSLRLVLRLAPVLLLPLALVGFQFYLHWRTGEFFATSAAEERGWGRTTDVAYMLLLPLAPLQAIWVVFTSHDLGYAFSAVCAGAWTWLLAFGAWTQRLPVEYLIYGVGSLVLPTVTGTWLGMPRFGLMLFPCFWMLAVIGMRPLLDHALRSAMPALAVGLAFVAYGRGTFTP